MDRKAFWHHIGHIDQACLDEEDEEGALALLIDSLSNLEPQDLFDFEEHLAQVLYALDGRPWLAAAGENDTDDSFLYARCFVVARGEAHYKAVLGDPARMPASCEEWCESLLYVASEAWARSTGNDPDDWAFDASVSYETGSNAAQW